VRQRSLTAPLPHPVASVAVGSLIAGVGEFALRLIARLVATRPVLLDPNTIWTGPVSALLVLAPLAAVAWLLARKWGAERARAAVLVMVAALVAFDLLLFVPRLHQLALALVAAGMATQVLALARRFPRATTRTLQGSVGVLGAAAVIGGGTVTLRQRGAPAPAVSAEAGAPNVILLVLDTVRALQLSAYGYARPTSPSLERMAAEGVRFDRAVATAPWTLATHATLFTGRYQHELSVGWTTALDTVPRTLAESFRDAGFATGGFVANLRYCTTDYGLARGFGTYRDYAISWSQIIGSTMAGRRVIHYYNALTGNYVLAGRKDAGTVVGEFLDWHDELEGKPFFGFLNVFDAHEPYAPPSPFDRLFLDQEPATRAIDATRTYTPAEVDQLRNAYDGSIASQDQALERLFGELRERGALDNTIVVITSDHGEEFGEHGHLSHGNGLHLPSLHVPLIIRFPARIAAGSVVPEPISLRDVPRTILDLARLSDPAIPGLSLLAAPAGDSAVASRSPILSELYWAPNQPDRYPVAAGNMRSLVRDGLHLIEGQAGPDELYDVMADPFERANLASRPEYQARMAALRVLLSAYPMRDRGGR
jgi:arylsulfatase A-like enzyme